MAQTTAVASRAGPQGVAWRVKRQHLDSRTARGQALAVVRQIRGLHAQVMSSAELTLWARGADLDPDAVQKALWEERALVKTWAMRGGLPLLPAAELSIWVGAQGALKPRYHAPSWLRHFGLTREEAEALIAAIPEALDGRMLTREELAQEVVRLVGSEELGGKLRHSWGALLKPAAFRGHLIFAPSLGQNVRFTRPERWLAQWQPVETEDRKSVV